MFYIIILYNCNLTLLDSRGVNQSNSLDNESNSTEISESKESLKATDKQSDELDDDIPF